MFSGIYRQCVSTTQLALVALVMQTLAVSPAPDPDAAPSPVQDCASDYCPPSIPGPVTQWPWTPQTRFLRLSPTKVELEDIDGSAVWSVPMNSAQVPDLVAEGDFTGDGAPDYVLVEVRPAFPVQYCVSHVMSESQLVFVDGATGASSRPIPPSLDLCWPNFGYATHQWGVGTAYIGRFQPARSADEVVVFPYYSTSGWVLSFNARIGWRRVVGARDTLAYPSTPAFDHLYNSANTTPCATILGRGECFVQYSHVPNAVFIGTGGAAVGLFVLTSMRAVIYRPDFTPTSNYVWEYGVASGRNYGLVESHDVGRGQMVTLVGGCSVAKTRDSMRLGQLSGDACGLEHHFEYFLVEGQSIVEHSGRYYGWAGHDGIWQNRLEFPFPSSIPLTGGSLWSVFNLYRDGQWRLQLLPDPADPNHVVELPGWYVWGSVTDRAGHTLLAATRTRSTSSTSVASYVPPWEFDLLRWQNGGLVSVAHHDGVVPSLALYPPGPGYHVSDGDTFGLVEKGAPHGGPNVLLVETLGGGQSYISVPDSGSNFS